MPRFVHHQLNARDPIRASAFYRDLFGGPIDESVATIVLSKAPPHVPSSWLPFLGVSDVDAATEKARALGAQVRRHTTGHESVIVDPRGAVVGLRPLAGAKHSSVFAWDELLTDDPAAAAAFYAALAGLTIETIDLGPAGQYYLLCSDGLRIAGVAKHPANIHPHWLPYFTVADVDAVTARALQLGATSYFAPKDQPGFGRWSAIDDPVGAGICLLKPKA